PGKLVWRVVGLPVAGLEADALGTRWIPDGRRRLGTAKRRPPPGWHAQRAWVAIWDWQELRVEEVRERIVVEAPRAGDRTDLVQRRRDRRHPGDSLDQGDEDDYGVSAE